METLEIAGTPVKVNFTVERGHSMTQGNPDYVALDGAGKLIATISLHYTGLRYSDRFYNVCFNDGKVRLADGLGDAPNVIENYLFRTH
jgi:hypothetical protein